MSETHKMKAGPDELAQVPSMVGEVLSYPALAYDDVFGEVSENGPNFRNV